MRYFSTFSGIGGFEYGIQSAFDKQTAKVEQDRQGRDRFADKRGSNVHYRQESPLCVGYSEIDKYAIKVYERHFNHKNYGDITKINADTLPDFDCLVGGFPCQAFSIAGKRRGFEDTRGTLFFDLARILRAKQPRLFVFENVKGLLSHDNGNTFRTIIQTIDELGYDYQWQVLNSKNHGVPQNRERVIIVGHLRGTSRPEVFPIGYSQGETDEIGVSKRPGSRPRPIWTVSDAEESRREIQSRTSIRRLTPVECERLQGFPDDWTKYGLENDGIEILGMCPPTFVPISDSQRYKMCGNAVTTNVIEAVFDRIFDGR